MTEEVCPVCAERGITEPRKVQIEKNGNKITKRYSPCGHRHVIISVEEHLRLRDEVSVTKEAVLDGYTNLSSTFDVNQVNLVQRNDFESNLLKIVDLSEKLVEQQSMTLEELRKGGGTESKRFNIQTIIAIVSIIIAIIAILLR